MTAGILKYLLHFTFDRYEKVNILPFQVNPIIYDANIPFSSILFNEADCVRHRFMNYH